MLTGVILAGGKIKWPDGSLKSLTPVDGNTVIGKQLTEMQQICSEIFIVTDNIHAYLPIVPREIRIITDYHKHKGPLGGIHAALSLSKESFIWVVSCDMSYISSNAAKSMLKQCKDTLCGAVLPVVYNQPFFFHSIYCKDIVMEVEKILRADVFHYSILLNHIDWMKADQTFITKKLTSSLLGNLTNY